MAPTKKPVIIACLLKSGPEYTWQYVKLLRDRLRDCADLPFNFVCLTDVPKDEEGVEIAPIRHYWPAWWSKIELFRPDLFPRGRPVLYFDLDTLLVRDINALLRLAMEMPEEFFMLRGFNKANLLRGDVPASGVMLWRAGCAEAETVYRVFTEDPPGHITHTKASGGLGGQGGDQGFIGNVLGWNAVPKLQDYLPEGYILGKKHTKGMRALPRAHVVAWSGQPRPLQAVHNTPWIREALNV